MFDALVALVEGLVDLEVDVRPAPGVAAGKIVVNSSHPSCVGLLHAAQVVLVDGVAVVHRVVALPVAVPGVQRGAGQRRDLLAGQVVDPEPEGQRHALGHARRRAEARGDVAADHPRLGQHVGAVGAVARVRARRSPRGSRRRRPRRRTRPPIPPSGGPPAGGRAGRPGCWLSTSRRRRGRSRRRVATPTPPTMPSIPRRPRPRRTSCGRSWDRPEVVVVVVVVVISLMGAGCSRRHPSDDLCVSCAGSALWPAETRDQA